MNTYTQIIYQIVFGCKNHQRILTDANRPSLYYYIWGLLKKKKCHLYRIGGFTDHLHIVTHLHPTIALSSLVKDIKIASALYIKENNIFPMFESWQDGYAAFTYSIREKAQLIEYVKKQDAHHKVLTFKEEIRNLLIEQGIA